MTLTEGGEEMSDRTYEPARLNHFDVAQYAPTVS